MSFRWTAAAAYGLASLVFVASLALAQGPETGDPEAPFPPVSASGSASASPPGSGSAPVASSAPTSPPPVGSAVRVSPATAARPQGSPFIDRQKAPKCDPCPTPASGWETGDKTRLRYVLEGIDIRGNDRTGERVIRRYIKLRAGEILDVNDPELELMRYRLLGTGYFSSVNLSLRKGARRGNVVLVVDVIERNTVVVSDLWMGLSADADTDGNARPLTAYAGVDVAETNLAGTGITLGGGMGFAQDQLALRMRFFDPAFLGTHWMTSATLLYNDAREFYGNKDVLYDDPSNAIERVQDFAVVGYKRFGGSVGVGHDLGIPIQLWLDYRLERVDATLPLAASHRRGLDIEPIDFGLNRGLSVLSTLRATMVYDTRDSPILPTRGSHGTLAAEVSLSPFGSDYPYQKLSLDASRWFQLPWKHVVRFQLFAGGIAGYAPIYERFYVGDFSDFLPSRMLGLNTDARPPPNFLGTDVVEIRYGEYASKVQGEYRIPLYRGFRSVYGIDFFGSAGIYGVASGEDISDPPRGYSGAARIPVDLTFNLGLKIDTSAGGFAFAFSNILGFIPVRSEATP